MADLEYVEKNDWVQVSTLTGADKERFGQKCTFLKGLAVGCDFIFVGDGHCRTTRGVRTW